MSDQAKTGIYISTEKPDQYDSTKYNNIAWVDTNQKVIETTDSAGKEVIFTPRYSSFENNPILYKIPSNWLSSGIEHVTKSGAISTATITAVGAYDKLAVTGGNNTSRITIDGYSSSMGAISMKVRVKLDSIGSSSCLLGVGLEGFLATQDTGVAFPDRMYINLTSGIIYELFGQISSTANALTTNSLTGTFASTNDIIELEWFRDPVLDGTYKIIVTNITTGSYSIAKSSRLIQHYFLYMFANPSLLLADGTFTIIDFSITSICAMKPKLHFIGDSIGIGYNNYFNQQIEYKTLQNLPYNIVNSCGNGGYIYGINSVAIKDVLRFKSEIVVGFFWISIYYGEFVSGNANNTEYMAQWNSLLLSLQTIGTKVIFFKVNPWALGPVGNAALWNTFITAQQLIYPNIIIADATGITQTYDSSGYHFSEATCEAYSQVIIKTMKDNNLL